MRPSASAHSCRSYSRRALLGGVALALIGCNLDNPGDEPPRGTLYFPNALALSPHAPGEQARYLFVANSNFDLRFKAGSVQAFSLEALDDQLADCSAEDPCQVDDTELVLADEVLVSSFATSLAPSPDGRYLFVTTRTDESLNFIRLNLEPDADQDEALDCGSDERRCGLYAARAPSDDDPGELRWPNDPAAVTAGPLSDWSGDPADTSLYALVAHRGGEVSLFIEQQDVDGEEVGPVDPERFELRSVLSGVAAPFTNVGFDPATGLAHLTTGVGALARIGVVPPAGDSELGSLYSAGPVFVPSVLDSRDVTFLPAVADAGEALSEASALIVAQEPSALLLADVDQTRNLPGRARVKRTAVVGAGASRVASGVLGRRPIAVVACFDARALFVIDLQTMLTLSIVPNLSGPFEIALDEERMRVYVADFRSSVIRIVDLSMLADTQGEASAAVIGTLGKPRVIQELR